MKTSTLAIAAAAAVGLFIVARRASAAAPAAGLSLADIPVQRMTYMGPITAGGSPYGARVTNTAATLPYGFNNATPNGEPINGFV